MSAEPVRDGPPAYSSSPVDAVCIGETMVMMTPVSPRPLAGRPDLAMEIGGAESNVACGLAQFGHRVSWVSRVGDDPFGRLVAETVSRRGVDVSGVEVDPGRPTGIYFKDPLPEGTVVHYYRSGSAASAMGPGAPSAAQLRGARLMVLSGITPALSRSCAELVEALLEPGAGRPETVAFDVNYRPALWSAGEAGSPLLELARRSDVVFVGRDEAEALWAASTVREIRELLPDVGRLVVKDAEHGATSFEGDEATHVSALPVEVVEPVGAGDAFAAGYLAGLLDGRQARDRLRLGHAAAAETLKCVGDLAPLPAAADLEYLLLATEAEWSAMRKGNGDATRIR